LSRRSHHYTGLRIPQVAHAPQDRRLSRQDHSSIHLIKKKQEFDLSCTEPKQFKLKLKKLPSSRPELGGIIEKSTTAKDF